MNAGRRLRRAAGRRVPRFARPALRRAQRARRRLSFRIAERRRPVNLDRRDVVEAFRAAGVREGDGVYLQSAMSRFGRIEGGPATVVGALREAVGEGGLIAMPAFPIVGGAREYLESDPVFDVRRTPSRMGAISEHFRTMPGVVRSMHPTHSVSADGPGAEELVAGHEEAPTPFGEGTPFPRMVERRVHAIAFGTGVHVFTFYHSFEDLREGGYPLKVYLDGRYYARCIDAAGREQIVSTPVHDPALAAVRIDNNPPLERRMQGLLMGSGAMRSVRLGKGELLAIRAPDLITELERLLARGITIYEVDLPAGS